MEVEVVSDGILPAEGFFIYLVRLHGGWNEGCYSGCCQPDCFALAQAFLGL